MTTNELRKTENLNTQGKIIKGRRNMCDQEPWQLMNEWELKTTEHGNKTKKDMTVATVIILIQSVKWIFNLFMFVIIKITQIYCLCVSDSSPAAASRASNSTVKSHKPFVICLSVINNKPHSGYYSWKRGCEACMQSVQWVAMSNFFLIVLSTGIVWKNILKCFNCTSRYIKCIPLDIIIVFISITERPERQ